MNRVYTASGAAAAVDAFAKGRGALGSESLGGYKTAYFMGDAPKSVPAGIEIGRMDLQKLFIQLTNV
jgi:hypothetical protein